MEFLLFSGNEMKITIKRLIITDFGELDCYQAQLIVGKTV
jgi:hypothetical protein